MPRDHRSVFVIQIIDLGLASKLRPLRKAIARNFETRFKIYTSHPINPAPL